ncbi:lipolytic enzyme, G-D-S-L [Marinobacterium lacunae]|uniref:Lipolytic enzyme, G-D-S-L n=1 Tax=Marinobacterium lacunae TaxID=1232683 RepID=A0A081G4A8_9GAMM|nr:arylesterase [Marinobacterium lacunae]KEA65613.1 lipolytic enzyme, G-D-S-L [Marinobacterium lacunae]
MIRRIFVTAMMVVAVLLQGCGSDKLTPLADGAAILAFGDSLTKGYGVDEAQSYPSVLAHRTGYTVINAGVYGEITAQGVERLGPILEREQPQLLILLEGGNDILRGIDPAETKNNLARMIELARNQGVEVILVGVPHKNLFSSYAPFYGELAEDYQLPFADSIVADLLRNPKYKSDQVHFNAAGYRRLAESLEFLLREEGAL